MILEVFSNLNDSVVLCPSCRGLPGRQAQRVAAQLGGLARTHKCHDKAGLREAFDKGGGLLLT